MECPFCSIGRPVRELGGLPVVSHGLAPAATIWRPFGAKEGNCNGRFLPFLPRCRGRVGCLERQFIYAGNNLLHLQGSGSSYFVYFVSFVVHRMRTISVVVWHISRAAAVLGGSYNTSGKGTLINRQSMESTTMRITLRKNYNPLEHVTMYRP